MLARVVSVIFGGILFAAGAYTLYLQFTDPEGTRGFILAMAGALLLAGAITLMVGLRPRR